MSNHEAYELIYDCETCYKNSFREHRSKKVENEFHLCEHCTANLELIKGNVIEFPKKKAPYSNIVEKVVQAIEDPLQFSRKK